MRNHNFHVAVKDVLWTLTAVIVIPGLAFWLIGQFWFIDRAIFNIDYMVLCLLLIPFGVTAVGLGTALILVLDVVFSLAPAYHFSLTSVIDSMRDLTSLEPGFLVAELSKVILIVFACTALVWLCLKKARSTKIIAMTCLVSAVTVVVLDIRLSVNTFADSDTYTLNTNIAASSINNLRIAFSTADHNLPNQFISPAESAGELLRESLDMGIGKFQTIILIVVESLGEITSPELNRYQMEPVLALKNQAGIVLNTGLVRFKGSTVPGELRELCGIQLLAVHPDVSILPGENCLPNIFSDQGYRTLAIHGFLGAMFSRNRWYPSLAFDDIWFAPELDERIINARRCGIAFNGICDEEVWSLIGELVSTESGSKQFIYWLTLSAHLPVENHDKPNSESCDSFDVLVQYPSLCNLVLRQREFFSSIAMYINDRKLTNTRILMVGDHSPPFLSNEIRSVFNSEYVPFIDIQIPGNLEMSGATVPVESLTNPGADGG